MENREEQIREISATHGQSARCRAKEEEFDKQGRAVRGRRDKSTHAGRQQEGEWGEGEEREGRELGKGETPRQTRREDEHCIQNNIQEASYRWGYLMISLDVAADMQQNREGGREGAGGGKALSHVCWHKRVQAPGHPRWCPSQSPSSSLGAARPEGWASTRGGRKFQEGGSPLVPESHTRSPADVVSQ